MWGEFLRLHIRPAILPFQGNMGLVSGIVLFVLELVHQHN